MYFIRSDKQFKNPLPALFLCFVCLFSQTEAGQAARNSYFLNDKKPRIELVYQMSDYLNFSMETTKKSMESSYRRAFHKIPVHEVIKNAYSGDPVNQLFLIYLYLDQWLRDKHGKHRASPFAEKRLTDEEERAVESSLMNAAHTHNRSLIEGWKALFSELNQFVDKHGKREILKHSFRSFLHAKKDSNREFQFQWAFLIMTMNHYVDFEQTSVHEAQKIIVIQARDGYVPAVYLRGVMHWKQNNIFAAVHWLRKAYADSFHRRFAAASLGLIHADTGSLTKAVGFLNEAVYTHNMDFLKPELLSAHLRTSDKSEAFRVASEIAENYTEFPMDVTLNTIEYVIISLLHGFGTPQDIESAFIWTERVRLIAAENDISINFYGEPLNRFKRNLTPHQMIQAQERAAFLHAPTKLYSQMGASGDCDPRLFH